MEDLLVRLKQAVLPYHDEVHRLPILKDLPSGRVALLEYRRLLERLYGFWEPVEAAVEALIPYRPEAAVWNPRVPLLAQDLAFLGVAPSALESIPRCRRTPEFMKQDEALGYLYLSEGSRLGGRMLGDIVEKALALTPYSGFAYFSSDGADVEKMWSVFRDFLRSHAKAHHLDKEIIHASRSGFAALNRWLTEL